MVGDSFQFGKYNSLVDWGIKCIKHDFALPPKQSRTLVIPGRSGVYDFGANTYGPRALRVECDLLRQISTAEFREITYLLSGKKQLRFWDEPEKYYIGEIYEAPEVVEYPQQRIRRMELVFACEPFAYAPAKTLPIHSGDNQTAYRGTAPAPCVITIHNPNAYAVSNLVVKAVKRRI